MENYAYNVTEMTTICLKISCRFFLQSAINFDCYENFPKSVKSSSL
jgi:hypothetical protein